MTHRRHGAGDVAARLRERAVPFETIAEALEEPAGRATFARGLVLGALVGAAVVGSLLRARHASRSRHPGAAGPHSSLSPTERPPA